MRGRVIAGAAVGVLMLGGLQAGPTQAAPTPAASGSPASITALSGVAGERPGEVIFRWQSSGANTTHFVLETGLTAFSRNSRSLPAHGRNTAYFRIDASKRTFVMNETQAAYAGAAVVTGRHLYFRLFAVNATRAGSPTVAYPTLQAVLPRAIAPKPRSKGTYIRAATFNVRTARATTDKRHWMVRKAAVAKEIVDSRAHIVAIQEMSPGRADGKNGATTKFGRQTTSLLAELAKIGAGRFKLVRTTSYRKPGTKHGSQGARILYDSKRFELLSDCPERTGKRNYNPSCTIQMPILATDSETARRKAAYAAFEDRSSGQRFYMVSAHLDHRHSGNATTESRYNQLRGNQMRTVLAGMEQINTRNRPVIFGGDINSWQNNKIGHAPHDALIEYGYYDTVAATQHINLAYPTINHYRTALQRSTVGIGTRIDAVMIQGAQGSSLYWNKTTINDAARPSDHNLVAADVVL